MCGIAASTGTDENSFASQTVPLMSYSKSKKNTILERSLPWRATRNGTFAREFAIEVPKKTNTVMEFF